MQSSTNRFLVVVAGAVLTLMLVGGFALFAISGVSTQPALAEQAEVSPQPDTATAGLQVASEAARTITVVGEGTVSIEPDIAVANIGVDLIGKTIGEAADEAEGTMNAIFEALKAQGIAEKDIQTSGFNTWIERPYGGPDAFNQISSGEAIYHINNTVVVVIRDLDSISDVLSASIEAGANNIFGVSFSIDDPSAFLAEARADAVADAKARAEELAGLNGATVGDLVEISEIIGSGGGFFNNSTRQFEVAAYAMGGGGGPIAPGELDLSVQLQITYQLAQ